MIAICCVRLVKPILSWEASCVVKIKTQKRLMQWSRRYSELTHSFQIKCLCIGSSAGTGNLSCVVLLCCAGAIS